VDAVFIYHRPEIFDVFAEGFFKLRKYDVEDFVIRGGNGLCAETADSIFEGHGDFPSLECQKAAHCSIRYIL